MLKVHLRKSARRLAFALILVLTLMNASVAFAQEATATPGVVNLQPLSPPTADPNLNAQPTATPMPTQASLVRVEAVDFANVRAEPDVNAPQLGTIRAGETYTVIARYISWIQFQFPSAPNGRGWVYGEIVRVTGDLSTVPEIANPFGTTTGTTGADVSGEQATLALLIQTPGGVLTATVLSPALPGSVPTDAVGLPTTPRPTFTYPPGLVALAPTQADVLSGSNPSSGSGQTGSSGPAPIVPIIVLGGIGVIGLLIGSLRRGG